MASIMNGLSGPGITLGPALVFWMAGGQARGGGNEP